MKQKYLEIQKVVEEVQTKYKGTVFTTNSKLEFENLTELQEMIQKVQLKFSPFLKSEEERNMLHSLIDIYSMEEKEELLKGDWDESKITWHWWGVRWHIGLRKIMSLILNKVKTQITKKMIEEFLGKSIAEIVAEMLGCEEILDILGPIGIAVGILLGEGGICIATKLKALWTDEGKNAVAGWSWVGILVNCYTE